jgi:hypothetical protein
VTIIAYRERHGFLGGRQHAVQRPPLGVLAYGRAADERARLDGHADLLGDLRHRAHVGHHGARRAVRPDGETALHDLPRQRRDGLHRTGPRAGEADVGGVDAQAIHEVQKPDLVLDGRIHHRRILETVAQRLVVQLHPAHAGPVEGRARQVPIVDQLLLVHGPLGTMWSIPDEAQT